ncbi:PHA-granule associated protein 4 [Cupriavidus sp. BIC8F]|uniref:PHA-granule associated protein 4 n=1 Tax=Cupriavidus sp. BIC8F TaxID=3079014 RepID=UPI0029170B18|nr:PHA-granule associated protein 4 [Cupriavidus sp. BIC8F]
MATALAGTKAEALKLLETAGVTVVDLDYESGWQDAIELGRLGDKRGVRIQYRGHESIAVRSPAALLAGLSRPKLTFRQRNLYCQFEFSSLEAAELERLEIKAAKLGDYVLAGHLIREVDAVWDE